jgi:hypothetical protein
MRKEITNLKITKYLVNTVASGLTLVPLSLGIGHLINMNFKDDPIRVAANLLVSAMYFGSASILGSLFYFGFNKDLETKPKEKMSSSSNKIYIKA